jgi:hypothetical protein
MRISKHISYREATRSVTAERKGYDNTPNAEQLENMKLLAKEVFEPLREHFNKPIKVESFFRCYKLNKAIGGSKNSQHMKGEAIDIDDDFGGLTNADMFYYIADHLKWDQLIWEFGDNVNPGWIHVSYKESGNRNKISIAYKVGKRTYYKHFYELYDFIIFKEGLYNSQ